MNDNLDPAASAKEATTETALTLQQHAMQEIDAVAEGIATLQQKYGSAVFDVSTTKGMAEAKAARQEIRQVRYDVERIRKEKGAELKKIATAINDRASDITAPIRELEDPIDSQIKAEEERKEAEREARRQAEAERVAAMNARLDNIRNMPLHAVGASADEIQQAIDKLDGDGLDGFDEVYLPTAQQTKDAALASLSKLLDERRALDEQAAELERQRREQAAREAEEAEARRQQQEREDAERRERQAREDADRAAKQAEEDRQRAEQAERERAEREAEEARLAEQRRQLEAEQAAQREAEAKAEQERQEAAQRAEADRLAREQAEAEEREQARAQAAAEAARRDGMLFIVDAPDGSRWAVPVLAIALDRAAHYAKEFDGDAERSLEEDTMPLFEADPYNVQDWAVNNMNWSDVKAYSYIYAPAKPITDEDMQDAWMEGAKEVVMPAKAVQS